MTEAEAKTKICPAAMQAVLAGSLIERPQFLCIASKCMAWRHVMAKITVLKDGTSPEPGQMYLARDVEKTFQEATGGFCGLAGTP